MTDVNPEPYANIVVIDPHSTTWQCRQCGGAGWLLKMEDGAPCCMACADLDHLVFLPAGDTALTRRARQYSALSAVVVRFSRARRRYERQGVLVEEVALARAERECLAERCPQGPTSSGGRTPSTP